MRKCTLILIIGMLSINLTMAQFICSISSKVKEVANEMVKKSTNSKDNLIIGDYRVHGTGWILLPDHTGAYYIQNVQLSELVWGLAEEKGNLILLINVFENELNLNGTLQTKTQNIFLANIKSDTLIELLDTKSGLTLTQYRTKLIPGKVYSQIRKIENPNKAEEPFSVFAKKYVDDKLVTWEKKGDYEKTIDWQTRVNDINRKQKVDELMDEAVDEYSKWALSKVLGMDIIIQGLGPSNKESEDEDQKQYYFEKGKSSGKYDADNEIYTLNVAILGAIPLKMPANEAADFDKNRISMNDAVFFIQDDQVALAKAKFKVNVYSEDNGWKTLIYKYVNPNAVNRKKTKNEILNIQKQQAKEQLLQAEDLFKNNNYEQSISCYQKAINLNPDIMSAINYSNLGSAYLQTKEYSRVIDSYKRALVLDSLFESHLSFESNIKSLYFNLGISYYAIKDFPNAMNALKKSLEFDNLEPNSGTIYFLIGQVYFELKDYVNSINSYQTSLQCSNANEKAIIYNSLGIAYSGQGDYVNAIKVLEFVNKIDPNSARPYYNLGNAYILEGNKNKAIKVFKKAAILGDKDAQAFLKEQQIEW